MLLLSTLALDERKIFCFNVPTTMYQDNHSVARGARALITSALHVLGTPLDRNLNHKPTVDDVALGR